MRKFHTQMHWCDLRTIPSRVLQKQRLKNRSLFYRDLWDPLALPMTDSGTVGINFHISDPYTISLRPPPHQGKESEKIWKFMVHHQARRQGGSWHYLSWISIKMAEISNYSKQILKPFNTSTERDSWLKLIYNLKLFNKTIYLHLCQKNNYAF